ncbi:MAG: aminopeptidase P family protein [Hyphomicrobium sp.]
MFQTFTASADPSIAAPRVAKLRDLMAAQKIDAFLVPRADEHQGEYVPPSAERLRWLTGFSGSAGLAAVTTRQAALFVDGRYTIQAAQECDAALFEFPGIARAKLTEWLTAHLADGAIVGFDPWLHTAGEIRRLESQLKPKGLKLKPLSRNLVDRAWGKERPASPQNPVILHPLRKAGRSAEKKIADVQKRLVSDGQAHAVLTLPDSICWLFNIRGSDIAHNPVVLAFAIVPASGKPELFIDGAKLSKEVRRDLETIATIAEPEDLKARVAELKSAGKPVRLDPETAAFALARGLGSKVVSAGPDPCIALKAIKNAAEIAGSRKAHVRDGAALVRYLAWLEGAASGGRLDEITAVRKLEDMRRATKQLREISFDTISGSGPHGAIVHYRVSEASNRLLGKGELFLLDSGAQYDDGTTDITRTIAIGTPSAEMKERATLVLKGHIAIATARFPKGTRGIDLDPFARRALWQHGLDYDHGTGHGVGSYLSVHEGPQSISRAGMVALEPGMICSNEPGYYKTGAYGIRIENLVLVTEPDTPEGGERPMMGFETLTLVPIDRRLVAKDLLSKDEREWLNAYHTRVREVIGAELAGEDDVLKWLHAATQPI